MKNITKNTLLVMVGTFAYCIQAKIPPVAHEHEIMRLAYQGVMNKKPALSSPATRDEVGHTAMHQNCQAQCMPNSCGPIEWKTMPAPKTASEGDVQEALQSYQALEDQSQALTKKRTDYLEEKYPVFKEAQELSKKWQDFCMKNNDTLTEAYTDRTYNDELMNLQQKTSKAYWTYSQLDCVYYQNKTDLVKKLARKAKTIKLAPGTMLDDTTNPRLPMLSPNFTLNPAGNTQVKSYNLYPLTSDGIYAELKCTIENKNNPKGLVGAPTKNLFYSLSIPVGARNSKFCIVQNAVNGDTTVLFNVEITKKEKVLRPQSQPAVTRLRKKQ